MGRIYSLSFSDVAVAAAQDLLGITTTLRPRHTTGDQSLIAGR